MTDPNPTQTPETPAEFEARQAGEKAARDRAFDAYEFAFRSFRRSMDAIGEVCGFRSEEMPQIIAAAQDPKRLPGAKLVRLPNDRPTPHSVFETVQGDRERWVFVEGDEVPKNAIEVRPVAKILAEGATTLARTEAVLDGRDPMTGVPTLEHKLAQAVEHGGEWGTLDESERAVALRSLDGFVSRLRANGFTPLPGMEMLTEAAKSGSAERLAEARVFLQTLSGKGGRDAEIGVGAVEWPNPAPSGAQHLDARSLLAHLLESDSIERLRRPPRSGRLGRSYLSSVDGSPLSSPGPSWSALASLKNGGSVAEPPSSPAAV